MDLSKIFDDVQMLIVANLQAAHLDDVDALKCRITSLEGQLHREKGVVCDMVSMCESEGIEVSVCDDCRCVCSTQDMCSCGECCYTYCSRCNSDHHAMGCVDSDSDEVCLSCAESRGETAAMEDSVLPQATEESAV